MDYSLRAARRSDKKLLAPWTSDTFAWGDYVVDAFDTWLEHPQSRVLVAADDTDEPIAVGRGVLLSLDELWLQGVRVHPAWRRRGIATRLGASLQEWGAEQGARVALLMVEEWNTAARDQVDAIGFRHTATWLRSFKPTRHSGRRDVTTRLPAQPLQRCGPAEVAPAYLAWETGDLSRAARRMMAVGWQWRRLHARDLELAAGHGALFAGPSGWAIAAPRDNSLEVGWMQTSPERAPAQLAALEVVALSEGSTTLEVMMPSVPWLADPAAEAGFELEPLLLYEKGL